MTVATKQEGITAIAAKWGPALTKAAKEGDMSDFRALFAPEVEVVLQNALGEESEFVIGDSEECVLSWEDFHELTTKDLKEQNYLKTESQCLGVLGRRLILETGRFNTEGEVYLESYSLITVDKDGKIVAVEAFTDPQTSSLMSAVGGSSS